MVVVSLVVSLLLVLSPSRTCALESGVRGYKSPGAPCAKSDKKVPEKRSWA